MDPNASSSNQNHTTQANTPQPDIQPGDENSHVGQDNEKNAGESTGADKLKKRKSDAVRRKIREFIEGGNMKVCELQEALGVTSTSYQRFMRMTRSHDGIATTIYPRAFRFFRKRELQGLKAAPKANKKTKTATQSGAAKGGQKKKQDELLDVSGVHLDGEESEEVPVYDTCDEARRKIRTFLRKPEVSQQAFCRALSGCLGEDRGVQSRQLNAFLAKKGRMRGNTSPAFYASYVFFEKRRLKDGKPKTQMRQEMEEIHRNGVDTKTDTSRQFFICKGNDRPTRDKYGRLEMIRSGRR
ncbi:hypothetical protein GGR52DRAFT_573868 [Hypoxylon sp. FL1284]|nr:hypothetical protein GGR52DRAFT_573868 [Hypoxylon sp. FL1284]